MAHGRSVRNCCVIKRAFSLANPADLSFGPHSPLLFFKARGVFLFSFPPFFQSILTGRPVSPPPLSGTFFFLHLPFFFFFFSPTFFGVGVETLCLWSGLEKY